MKVGAGWIATLCSAALLLPGLADADPIAGSVSQVGAWRVTAYTRGRTASFDHCTFYRMQNEGFGFAVSMSTQGVWLMGGEALDWNFAPNELYSGTIELGAARYNFGGRPAGPHAMDFNVAPEIYGQLKSSQQLAVTINQKRHAISLDGIEAAVQRVRDCVRQYAAATPPPAQALSAQPSTPTPSAPLVVAIQTLLARLGYDPGPVTGEVGLKTNMAISAFQKSIGERGDGLPSEAPCVPNSRGSSLPAWRRPVQRRRRRRRWPRRALVSTSRATRS